MPDRNQNYGSHRRFIPEFHFFALPVLAINAIMTLIEAWRHPGFRSGWMAAVAIALVIGIWTARAMALRAQDRIIRLEERTRLERLLPADLRGRIGDLTPSQLIAIRFAPDDEVPELVRRTLARELMTQGDIKRAIRNWRADVLRV
jgi:uncharacterized protein DUF6526